MASESIIALKRPGFPTYSINETSYTTTIEYVGLYATLEAASPAKSTAWGDYSGLVATANIEPTPGTSYGILLVVCERKFDTSGGGTGTKLSNQTTYEIDWNDLHRSLLEHPQFRTDGNGQYKLTATDLAQIESWKKMDRADYKAEYFYYTTTPEAGITATLSDNAKMFAKGILLGIEYYVDKVPVARRSDTWVLGPPPSGVAGLKETPVGFPNLPQGYEWIRDADRALRAGGQDKWTNETSWLGSDKVQVDSKNILYTI